MDDLISRQAAMKAVCIADCLGECNWYPCAKIKALLDLPSAQPGWATDVNDILAYLDGVVHPLVSPENWNVYSELHDMVSGLLKPWKEGQNDG